MEVRSHTVMELYEDVREIRDLRILNPDLYLQPKEARTGWMYFPTTLHSASDVEVNDATIEFCIGDDLYIRESLSHSKDPRRTSI